MINIVKSYYKKYFSHPEVIWLLLFLVIGFGLVITIGHILAPVLISIVIVYLIEWLVSKLVTFNIRRNIAYLLIYLAFLTVFVGLILFLLLLWRQLSNLFKDLPIMLLNAKAALIQFAEQYPSFLPKEQIDSLGSSILIYIQDWAKHQVSSSFSYISLIITWLVYLFLVPLLVFFLLKDRDIIISWIVKFMPKNRRSLKVIYLEMDQQIGNYLRGKIIQISIGSFLNGAVFLYFNLNYAILLAVLVGFAAIVPYVGTVLASIPLIFVGYLQWGFNADLAYLLISYMVIQIIDGNVLVPILFSKAVNLHPVAIVIAVLLFGHWWGFWGVVFAIPLATLVKTVLLVWPINRKL